MPNLARLANLNFVEKQPLYNEVGYNYVDICSFFQNSVGVGLGVIGSAMVGEGGGDRLKVKCSLF